MTVDIETTDHSDQMIHGEGKELSAIFSNIILFFYNRRTIHSSLSNVTQTL